MGAKGTGRPETAYRGGTEQIFRVRCETFRSIEQLHNLGRLHGGDAGDDVLHQRREAFPVRLEQLEIPVLRDALQAPWLGLVLVPSGDHAAACAAEIDQVVGVAHGWHGLRLILDRLGDEIKMRHRDDRQGQPDHVGDVIAPQSRGVDDDIGLDHALIGGHFPDFVIADGDACDARVHQDPCPAALRSRGESVRQAGRVDLPIRRKEDTAFDILQRHQREELQALLRSQHIERHAKGFGISHDALELFHAGIRGSNAQTSDLIPARVDTRFTFQPAIQVGAVAHHLGKAGGGAQLSHQPGGVEGRAAGQLVALDDDDILPAHLGQMIGNACSSDSTPDDDRLCVCWEFH